MRRELCIIIGLALTSILTMLIEPDTKTIFNLIALIIVTVIDCIYIYTVHHIDVKKRPEKIKRVYFTGIILIVFSILLVLIEGIFVVEEYGIGSIFMLFRKRRYSRMWEFILSAILVYQIYKVMRNFSKSIMTQNTTDWFYENEDNQEEK